MTYIADVSPSRQYEITMRTHDKQDVITELITLPEALGNNRFVAKVYYQKYVPEGYFLVDAQPFVEGEPVETEEQEPEHVGFGDSLDYVGPDEEEDDGESFVSLSPLNDLKD